MLRTPVHELVLAQLLTILAAVVLVTASVELLVSAGVRVWRKLRGVREDPG